MARLLVAVGLALLVLPPGAEAAPECFGQEATIVGTPGNDPDLDGTSGADVIVGLGGMDQIEAGDGDDLVCGGANPRSPDPAVPWGDSLRGGDGEDRLSGGKGWDGLVGEGDDDELIGGRGRDATIHTDATGVVLVDLADGVATGTGEDTLSGIEDILGGGFPDDLRGDGAGNMIYGGPDATFDLIYGRGGDDALRGWFGNDTVAGGPGADTLWGSAGDDELRAGPGADLLFGDTDLSPVIVMEGDDEIDGGSGTDHLDLRNWPDPLDIDLAAGTAEGQGEDEVAGIENVTGGDGFDAIVGNEADNELLAIEGASNLSGAGGDDTLVGDDAVDTISGGDGADVIRGKEGMDTLSGGAGGDVIRGDDGDDGLGGGDGRDVVSGGDGGDDLGGGSGTDRLTAGAGIDEVEPGTGSDSASGGADYDSLFYGGGFPGPLTIDLAAGTTRGAVDQDVSGFEEAHATNFDDVVRGTDGANLLRGLGGDDELYGRAGDDTLLGFLGQDDMFGGPGDDTCDPFEEDGDTAHSCASP